MRWPACRLTATGFNEARADSPGRLNWWPLSMLVPFQASMRPGPIRPGDIRPGGRMYESIDGFNEARADSPGRFVRYRTSPAAPKRLQ